MKEKIPLKAQLMGLTSVINQFANSTSSPRIGMLMNHVRQAPPVFQPDIPLIMHGFENQLPAYDIRMPESGVVVEVCQKYRKSLGSDSINENPLTVLIFQNEHTGEYDCVHIHDYNTNHRAFGSKYIIQPIVKNLRPGMYIKKDTIFARSPSKLDSDIYSTSVNANVIAIADMPATEDGFRVSESFCNRAALTEINSYIGSWGKRRYLLNTYGTKDHFKGYPDIGEKVREDGILFAFREYDEKFDALEMTNEALMEIDTVHDIRIHAEPGSYVYDILVESGIGEGSNKANTPPAIAKQSQKYIAALDAYYVKLLQVMDDIYKENPKAKISPLLTQTFVKAIASQANSPKYRGSANGRIKRTYKRAVLDEYRVVIHTTKKLPLDIGFKITDLNGGKGVICQKCPDDQMPRDEFGNRADIVYYYRSKTARLNTGGETERFLSAAVRNLTNEIKERHHHTLVREWNSDCVTSWGRLVDFYEASSPINYQWTQTVSNDNVARLKHINSIVEDSVRIILPIDSVNNNIYIVNKVKKVVDVPLGNIYVYDLLGNERKLQGKGFIGIQRFIVLDKSELKPMAVDSPLRQIHGLPAGFNSLIKDGRPSKVQAFTNLSETETRALAAMLGYFVAIYLTLANDPDTHKSLIKAQLETEVPTIVENLMVDVNRSRALYIIKDVLLGCGILICRKLKRLVK